MKKEVRSSFLASVPLPSPDFGQTFIKAYLIYPPKNLLFEIKRTSIFQKLDQKLDQKMNQKMDPKLDQKMDPKLDHKLDQKVNQKMDQEFK